MGSATPESFVAIDRKRLAPMWSKEFPDEPDAREREALEELMNAREPEQTARPSVETGMHDIFPQRLVLHTHPTLVNGLTCSVDGERIAKELFAAEAIWIPSINPGYVLSKRIAGEIAAYTEAHGVAPRVVLLQNHGLTVAGENVSEIHRLHTEILQALLPRIEREPDLSTAPVNLEQAERVKVALKEAYRSVTEEEGVVLFDVTRELLSRAESEEAVQPVLLPLTPDHIVYAGHAPLYVADSAEVADRYRRSAEAHDVPPKCVILRGLGLFTVASTERAAETARMLFRDATKITRYAESFGGVKAMDPEEVEFIQGWEVERFRTKMSLGDE
mgnify:FL=1